MKHVTALIIKFIMVAVVLEIVLYFITNLTFSDIMIISLAVTILAYIIGDLLILRTANNTVATVADIGLALVTIFAFNYLWSTKYISFTAALIASVVIGVGEWFFHKYVVDNVFKDTKAH